MECIITYKYLSFNYVFCIADYRLDALITVDKIEAVSHKPDYTKGGQSEINMVTIDVILIELQNCNKLSVAAPSYNSLSHKESNQ
ncbi:13731_t:CDS:2 [Cetraspora pellucida]|uniref:13731_t:CDS:1 n=1 Tax=Cetraspora pellucida TaxID=1433469 RepID=A0A9N9EYK5_9GLOM|nr:13731_t:CDS:2 [Cetraspora pellucida]